MGIPQDNAVKEGVKPNSRNSYVMFAKLLAGNDKKIRDKGLKKLKKWLSVRSLRNYEFTEQEIMVIWSGLFYCMWMSDMPLVQEELAESLSSLIHCFNNNDNATLLFIKCFHSTINKSWASLDQYRVDKYSMLIRRFLRQSLTWLANGNWNISLVQKLMTIYDEEVLVEKSVLGVKLHFVEIFFEELAKASKGKLSSSALVAILKPFARTIAFTKDARVRFQLCEFFRYLIKQTDVALDYESKYAAWKQSGCLGDFDLVVTDTDDSDDDDDDSMDTDEQECNDIVEEAKILDPRAGSVHSFLPQISVPVKPIRRLLKQHSNLPESPIKAKRLILGLLRNFKTLGKGKYPFAARNLSVPRGKNTNKEVEKAAKKLIKAESKNKKSRLMLKKLNKNKPKVISENDDDIIPDSEKGESKKKLKRKKSKKNVLSNDAKTEKNVKKRKISATFDVSDVEIDENKSPIGTKKIENSDSPPELDLPCGWIVEACVKNDSEPKKKIPDNWNVKSFKPRIVEEEVVVEKVSNKLKGTPKNLETKESEKKSTPMGKTNQKPLRLSLLNQSELKESTGDATPTLTSSTDKNVPKKSLKPSILNQSDLNGSAGDTTSTPTGTGKKAQKNNLPETLAGNSESNETEIVIPMKNSTPAFFAKAAVKAGMTAKTPTPNKLAKIELEQSLTKSGRRIIFDLDRNMAQEKSEYFDQIQRSPQIPFDSAKQPKQSALKAGLPPSPINPFYARRLNLNMSNSR